jgi:hypothetical protein
MFNTYIEISDICLRYYVVTPILVTHTQNRHMAVLERQRNVTVSYWSSTAPSRYLTASK